MIEKDDIVYLDDIDKGEPFVTEDDKFRDEYVKYIYIYIYIYIYY